MTHADQSTQDDISHIPWLQISRAHALVDEARALLDLRVPSALAARCDAIIAAGGPGDPPPGALPDEPIAAPEPPPRGQEGTVAPDLAAALSGDEDGGEPDADRCRFYYIHPLGGA